MLKATIRDGMEKNAQCAAGFLRPKRITPKKGRPCAVCAAGFHGPGIADQLPTEGALAQGRSAAVEPARGSNPLSGGKRLHRGGVAAPSNFPPAAHEAHTELANGSPDSSTAFTRNDSS